MNLESLKQLQIELHALAQRLQQVNNLGETEDAADLYTLIGEMVALVAAHYSAIPCQSGCSGCCIDSGLPRTSALEWQHIFDYLQEEMPPALLEKVLQQNQDWHGEQLSAFLEEQKRIEDPSAKLALPQFESKRCPFLVDDRCTVYPVRPAICRGFGYFTWRREPEVESQVFACQMAADSLLESLQAARQQHAALPIWNAVSDKVYELNSETSTGVMSTLPLWLMAHVDRGQLRQELNLKPDFAALLDAD